MAESELTTQLFSQAATLMFFGMAFVFAFLSMLIVVIRLFITPLAKKFPDEPLQAPQIKTASNDDQTAIVAAITVAVNKYRQQHK